jgi:hypothetical protein
VIEKKEGFILEILATTNTNKPLEYNRASAGVHKLSRKEY